MAIGFTLFVLLVGYVVFVKWKNRAKRAALLTRRLDDTTRKMLIALVPIVGRMPPDLQGRLEGKLHLFIDQVDFHGAAGLTVTPEMKLSIAGQACVLVAGNDSWFRTLRTIIVYPGAFRSRRAEQEGYIVTEGESVRIGESWSRGPVILSWADSERGAFIDDDGQNVVFHEFAHQLDDLSGETNGLPLLKSATAERAWIDAFNEAFERINRLLEIGKRPFLEAYGATAPEELFAVAVEAFFETPEALRREEPALYAVLAKYFHQDPAAWT